MNAARLAIALRVPREAEFVEVSALVALAGLVAVRGQVAAEQAALEGPHQPAVRPQMAALDQPEVPRRRRYLPTGWPPT